LVVIATIFIIGVAYFATRPGGFEGRPNLREFQQHNRPRQLADENAVKTLVFDGRGVRR